MIEMKNITLKQRFLQGYYLATPLFLILDTFFNVNIRIPFLQYASPLLRYGYYCVIFGCGLYIYKKPDRSAIVGLFENMISIIMLFATFFLALYSSEDYMEGVGVNPISMQAIINFLISGFIFILCFYNNPLIMKAKKYYK